MATKSTCAFRGRQGKLRATKLGANKLLVSSELKNAVSTQSRPIWPKGLDPFPFQLDARRYAITRLKSHRAVYLALDPGLGKTIVSALLANTRQADRPRKIVYICPPSLRPNVESEFKKWGLSNPPTIIGDCDLANAAPIRADVAFVDEAQRFKNEKAQRTAGLFQLLEGCRKIVFLSGTPMPNSRPVELWTILKTFAPDVFGTDFFSFARRYCGARKTHFGWKFDGFTNKAEFKAKLFKSFMLRQKKSLVQLPPLREGILTVGEKISPVISALETKILKHFTKEDLLEGRLTKLSGKAALHQSEYMRLLGGEKLKHIFPVIEHLIYDTDESFLIFAYHKTVIAGLEQFLANFHPIVISGKTPTKKRAAMIERFQSGKTRVGIMNTLSGGIGWNLTRCERVLLVEFSWRDGDNRQAIDRAHRIGLEHPVLAQYVVLKDSLDAKRLEVVLRKRRDAV